METTTPTRLLLRLYLWFLERREGREKEERNPNVWLPLPQSPLKTWPATQACALTGNRTGDLRFAGWHSIHWATPARADSFRHNETGRTGKCSISGTCELIHVSYVYFPNLPELWVPLLIAEGSRQSGRTQVNQSFLSTLAQDKAADTKDTRETRDSP